MRPPYFDDDPYAYDEVPVPRKRANCQVNQLSRIEGREVHMPVGRGWKRRPLDEPIIFEIFGEVYEIVALPPQTGGSTPTGNLPPVLQTQHPAPVSSHSTNVYH